MPPGIIILVFLAVLVMLCRTSNEGFASKPTKQQVHQYTEQLISNREILGSGTIAQAKDKMPWLDPVAYEDARHLARNGEFTKQSVSQIFN